MNNYVFFIDKEKDLLSQEIFALMWSAGANFHELESQLRYGASHFVSLLDLLLSKKMRPVIIVQNPQKIDFELPGKVILISENILSRLSVLLRIPLNTYLKFVQIYAEKGLPELLKKCGKRDEFLEVLYNDYEARGYDSKKVYFSEQIQFREHRGVLTGSGAEFVPEVVWHRAQIKSFQDKKNYCLILTYPTYHGRFKLHYFGNNDTIAQIRCFLCANTLLRTENEWIGYFPDNEKQRIVQRIIALHK